MSPSLSTTIAWYFSPYSIPDDPTILEVRVPIPQRASVPVVACFSADIMMPKSVSSRHRNIYIPDIIFEIVKGSPPKHPIYV